MVLHSRGYASPMLEFAVIWTGMSLRVSTHSIGVSRSPGPGPSDLVGARADKRGTGSRASSRPRAPSALPARPPARIAAANQKEA